MDMDRETNFHIISFSFHDYGHCVYGSIKYPLQTSYFRKQDANRRSLFTLYRVYTVCASINLQKGSIFN